MRSFPTALRERLERYAKRNGLSLRATMIVLLADAIDRIEGGA
jgi:hypothetical protein